MFILALGGSEYAAEITALNDWVNHLLLPVYGREISTTRPWRAQWHEHPEAVARLHALWLAWQQHTDEEAGLSGPSTWHRDHLKRRAPPATGHLRGRWIADPQDECVSSTTQVRYASEPPVTGSVTH